MNPKIEQIKQEGVTGEQPVFPQVESEAQINTNTQRVEIEKTSETSPVQEREPSQGTSPQNFSAMQENFVEDKGGIGAIAKSEWGSELDNKSGGTYSIDITKVSTN